MLIVVTFRSWFPVGDLGFLLLYFQMFYNDCVTIILLHAYIFYDENMKTKKFFFKKELLET